MAAAIKQIVALAPVYQPVQRIARRVPVEKPVAVPVERYVPVPLLIAVPVSVQLQLSPIYYVLILLLVNKPIIYLKFKSI